MIEIIVHSVPLFERVKKKEIDKIKSFEVVARLLKTAQEEVCNANNSGDFNEF